MASCPQWLQCSSGNGSCMWPCILTAASGSQQIAWVSYLRVSWPLPPLLLGKSWNIWAKQQLDYSWTGNPGQKICQFSTPLNLELQERGQNIPYKFSRHSKCNADEVVSQWLLNSGASQGRPWILAGMGRGWHKASCAQDTLSSLEPQSTWLFAILFLYMQFTEFDCTGKLDVSGHCTPHFPLSADGNFLSDISDAQNGRHGSMLSELVGWRSWGCLVIFHFGQGRNGTKQHS